MYITSDLTRITDEGSEASTWSILLILTRGATVTGCAPVVSFCCRGFISMISKVKMQEKNTERLKFHDFNICPNILHADANADAGRIAIPKIWIFLRRFIFANFGKKPIDLFLCFLFLRIHPNGKKRSAQFILSLCHLTILLLKCNAHFWIKPYYKLHRQKIWIAIIMWMCSLRSTNQIFQLCANK